MSDLYPVQEIAPNSLIYVVEDAIFRDFLAKAIGSLSALQPFFAANHFKDMGYNLQRTREGEYYHWQLDAGPGE